ncbi:UdgX family uracil-DNA binding protein [Planctomyces sp. SH-PL14]|uniref:UdgX family uracil-DNA binding protein n=1 Tax=Planctomyces sp. SH-PL14 TaxID=1632864 RepID=UPI00078E40E7|nr:UdgX family uracil-DNA binding protein [Planctomyces sp. SH-PL14]AMV20804.1 Uracil DNA glycosylase superfamily protein [Planctomyces sp. SH-PL14]
MHTITVTTFDDWRQAARDLLALGQGPEAVMFRAHSAERPTLGLTFDDTPRSTVAPAAATTVPRAFLELARTVGCHRDAGRWDLLYRTLWRLTHDEPELLEVITDDDVIRLTRMEKAVSRDAHKAKAFVRFRRIAEGAMEQYVAWHRPDHLILPLVAPFFSRRFPEMAWSILTPDASVLWDGESLHFGEGVPASAAPQGDALEELWKTYYGSIFNPARIKLRAMKREMPVRHWETLPETRIIPDLLADAPRRLETMARQTTRPVESAAAFLPAARDLASLAAAAACCQGCDLHARATQTVFGRGPGDARIVLIGEQPGDQEDLTGEPFVGPAGEVLNEALREAGIARQEVYLTNAVKHFHWEETGTRRLHKKPPARAMAACFPWLEAELAAIRPTVVVCLGATAAQVIVGRDTRLGRQRGVVLSTRHCERTLVSWHPSSILRAMTPEEGEQRRSELIEDLIAARAAAEGGDVAGDPGSSIRSLH